MARASQQTRSPLLSALLAVAGAWSFLHVLAAFTAPLVPQLSGGGATDGRGATQPLAGSAEEPPARSESLVQRGSAVVAVRNVVYTAEAAGLAAGALALWRAWLGPAADPPKKASLSERRRWWTALNVGNHAIYAILFIIRSFCYTNTGGSDRPFYYESYFLGMLCGPSAFLPSLLGWTGGQYNQPAVLKWMTQMNAPGSTAYPAFIAQFVSNPAFMYWYQIAEGTFHFMICLGGMRAFVKNWWPPKAGDADLKLMRWGLFLELAVMDVAYVIAYTCLPALSVPGHWGLTTIMMLIHHLNVVPDIVSGWLEYKAIKEERAAMLKA